MAKRTPNGQRLRPRQRYRSEDFQRAAELYESLSRQGAEVSHEEVDLRINSSAVDAQLEWANLGHLARNKKPGRQDLEAFETAYNAACGSLARGELAQADILLKRSKGSKGCHDAITSMTDPVQTCAMRLKISAMTRRDRSCCLSWCSKCTY